MTNDSVPADKKILDPKTAAPLSPLAKEHADTWFAHAGLGMFIHYDHASQQGLEASWPLVGGVSGFGLQPHQQRCRLPPHGSHL